MSKWAHREQGRKISKAVIGEKSTKELKLAKEFLQGFLDLRKSEKLYKTYINGTNKALKYNEKNKVYVDFKLDGTVTGRLSCAAYTADKPMGVSFHTLPREPIYNIRDMFTGPEGWSFIAADYQAMELRILAHIANEGNMQKAFKSGADLHTYTAQLLFDKENITKEERQIAKTVSFLIVYGGGAFNLSESMSISMSKAEKIIENYKNVYPGIFTYMEHVNEYTMRNGYSSTIFGRRRNLPDVKSKYKKIVNRALRQALNFTIQSPASDILLCSLYGISNQFKDKGMQARPVATVHDSIEIVCPKEETEEAINILYNEMVNYPIIKEVFNMEFSVPLAIDIEVGSSFGNGVAVEV
jgi:DNA polymerase-1